MKNCTLAIAAEFEKDYWREWAEWHHKLGFDDIWIVTNNWTLDGPVPFYVHTYRRDGQVLQLPVYNEWLHNHRKEYDWALVCDIDEFLWLPEEISEFTKRNSKQLCIGVPWVHFGDGGEGVPTSGSVVKRFIRCEGVYNLHVKQLINLKLLSSVTRMFFANPHFVCVNNYWLPWSDINGKICNGPYNNFEGQPLDKSKPFIAHYYTKTKEEWDKRHGPEHMRADCPQFVSEDWFYKENHNEVECTLLAEKT